VKRLFRLTDEELQKLLDASRPTPVMYLSGGTPMFEAPEDCANRVWRELGKVHGFIWESAEPALTGDPHDFYAESLRPEEPIIEQIAEARVETKS